MPIRIRLIPIIVALLLPGAILAQQKAEIHGNVYAMEDGARTPVDYAVVLLKPVGLYATTDAQGAYSIRGIDPGTYGLSIQLIGYENKDTTLVIKGSVRHDFVLTPSSFRLEEVHVVAEASKAGESTASLISRQAIDHSQTSSLRDIMALLPGATITNPDLSSAHSITLRSVSGSDMNSLGTAIIVDGAPMSNNANMEGITAAMNGVSTPIAGTSVSAGGASPTGGIDVRQLSTDNIESVEIIRGIPSVQYGDLTSGAVIINSKAGEEPLTVRLKADPKIYQAALSKGFRLGRDGGDLHLSGDYAYSNAKTTESYAHYRRLNLKGLWSKRFGSLNTSTALDLRLGKDTRDKNPDDLRTKLASGGTSTGYRINTNGTWNINRGWLKTIRYDLSNSFTWKESFHEQENINAASIFTTNMTDGTTVADAIGKRLFDTAGNEITNIGSSGAYAIITPYSYFCHYDFYGKEVNSFAKVYANLFKQWEDTSEKIIVGADFKSDGNLGQGLVFEEGKPPGRSNNESGYRERPLYDIPFVNQTGVFAESSTRAKVLNRALSLTAGLRFDAVGSLTALSPRINASMEIIPNIWVLRGGYGITAKAPTAAYLYPTNAYYDQVNINTSEATLPSDRTVMATTRIYSTVNPDLEMARNRKAEVGFDLTLAKRYRLSVTLYDELMKNGYSYSRDYGSFVWVPYKTWRIDGHAADGSPLFGPETDTHRFFSYYKPSNNAWEHHYGLEYEVDLGRFSGIRTSFFLNGAWMHSISSSSGETFALNLKEGSYVNSHVAVYDPFMRKYHYEKFLTTLRTTHNIPSIGFVVTLTTQFNVFTANWTEYHNDEAPQRYISNDDGQVYDFTSEMAADPSYRYMVGQLSDTRFIRSTTIPTVVFNLNVSKEIRNFLTASFYVNNLFNSRPLDPSEITNGAYTELNSPIYFGFELKMKI
ncbi:MAG: TonB-dependent receptor plug domain-containing protein [Bacteroidales bacterium]|nr:TonB-dependent receptor plug domain-containing protein [Bacteroidales bacterium]